MERLQRFNSSTRTCLFVSGWSTDRQQKTTPSSLIGPSPRPQLGRSARTRHVWSLANHGDHLSRPLRRSAELLDNNVRVHHRLQQPGLLSEQDHDHSSAFAMQVATQKDDLVPFFPIQLVHGWTDRERRILIVHVQTRTLDKKEGTDTEEGASGQVRSDRSDRTQ